MPDTLTDGTTTVTFPSGTDWTDQDQWSNVTQSAENTVDGGVVLDVWERLAGRPITLRSTQDGGTLMAPLLLPAVAALRAWTAVPGQELTLTFWGVTATVVLRHQDEPAFRATPVERAFWGIPVPDTDQTAEQAFTWELRLMEA